MRYVKLLVALLFACMAAVTATEAAAHGRYRSHARVGVFIGAPLWPWYYPPAYYYPPVITVPAPPPTVYIEQARPPSSAPQSNYWYYCTNPEGYYPYVKNCPGGWQTVAPQP